MSTLAIEYAAARNPPPAVGRVTIAVVLLMLCALPELRHLFRPKP